MKIYIPSYGRTDPALHTTYQMFSDHVECVVIAATKGSVPRGDVNCEVVKTAHVGEARAAIARLAAEEGCTRYIVADDDLKLFNRTDERTYSRVDASDHNVIAEFLSEVREFLDRFAHGGVQQRFMAHTAPRGYVQNKRYLKLAAYNTELMPKEPEFRLRVHEDIDAQLQLAAMGCSGFLMTEWAVDDLGQYKDGGCQRYRTPEVEEAEFLKLQRHHPDFVSFVNGRSRVAWARAYEQGASK